MQPKPPRFLEVQVFLKFKFIKTLQETTES